MGSSPARPDDGARHGGGGGLGPLGRPRWWGWIAVGLGLALIAAAVIVVWREQDQVAMAIGAMRDPSLPYITLLLGGVVANLLLTSLLFSLLISRYGRVGLLEMQALIASATLVNFLPLRPGLFGRIAYHKAVNRILAVHSAKTIVQASVISVSIVSYLGLVVAVSGLLGISLFYGAAAPIPILLLGTTLPRLRIWAAATGLRYLEVFVWALRYHAAFALIGSPIPPHGALAFACISMMATMLPFVSNGLGLREWAIGLAAPFLTEYVLEMGITAELVNRAAEIVVVVILGLAGLGWLGHRRRHYSMRGLEREGEEHDPREQNAAG
ncbi:MAG: hypothetical protein SYC29_16985 [Planctomycetota bacterium]|nr:hypothetical protein [Planctomycetota bacterium]